jgi:hypothetical protein
MIVIFMSPRLPEENPTLQLEINMAGPAAFRGIAGDIEKICFLVAAGTFLRGVSRSEGALTIAATPVSQVALRANIPHKFPGSRIATQGAFHLAFFLAHGLSSVSL